MPHATSVIFDLGGVLLNWSPEVIVAGAFADPEARVRALREVFEHPDWVELDRGTLSEEDAVPRFAARCGQPLERMVALMDHVQAHLAPQPASLALLEELHGRGVPLYCLSNMHARNAAYLRQRHAFFSWFQGIVFSCVVRMVKPEPGIYLHLLEQHGLDPATAVFVDDGPANVEAAERLGLHGLLFTSAEACRHQLNALLTTG